MKDEGEISIEEGKKPMSEEQEEYWRNIVEGWEEKLDQALEIYGEWDRKPKQLDPIWCIHELNSIKRSLSLSEMSREELKSTSHQIGGQVKALMKIIEDIIRDLENLIEDIYSIKISEGVDKAKIRKELSNKLELHKLLRELVNSIQKTLDLEFGDYQYFTSYRRK